MEIETRSLHILRGRAIVKTEIIGSKASTRPGLANTELSPSLIGQDHHFGTTWLPLLT